MKLQDFVEDYGMYFAGEVENAVVSLTAIGYQKRSSETYYWDNRKRYPGFLFQYTLSGSGMLVINGKKQKVSKNEAFFLHFPSDTQYYFDDAESREPWEFVYLLYRGEMMLPYYHYIEKTFGNVFPVAEQSPLIQSLFQIYHDVKKEAIRDPFLLGDRVFHFVSQLCSMGHEAYRHLSPKMERAKAFMDQEHGKAININTVAQHLSISCEYLSRQFYRETGIRPIEYLSRVRMEHAVRLLTDTNMTLEEIAGICGFSNGNYFQKVFKKQMNMTPGQFRNDIHKEGYSKVVM